MPSPVERELLSQATALRALARDLVGEQHADDLVQDTAVQALQSPPRRPGPLGGWLASIVRHLASKHRRGERRRQRREQLAARPECQLPDLAADDRDALRRLTRTLLALPEPYQTTLLLRYLRDLSPTEIASRMREPLRTVKTRLQRGLQLLRAALDGDGHDWRRAFAAAFGIERLASAATITTGVLLMGTGAKLMAGGAAAAALVTALWLSDGAMPESGRFPAANGQEPVVAAAAVHAAGAAPAEPSGRELAATAGPAAADPTLATIRGRCVDEHVLPLVSATVRIEARSEGENFAVDASTWPPPADETTGADGRFAFHFPVPDFVWFRVSACAGERSERAGDLHELAAGSVVDLGDVALLPAVVVCGRVVDNRGRPQPDVRVTASREVGDTERRSLLSARNEHEALTRVDGTFGPFQLPGPGHGQATVDRRLVEGPSHRFALVPGHEADLDLVVVSDDDLPPIRGVVVDETGNPLGDATVMLDGEDAARVAADGTFALRPIRARAGPFLVRANASFFASAQSGPHPLGTTGLHFVLQRLPELHVRVRAADTGDPVREFALDLIVADELGCRHSRNGYREPDGVARVPNVNQGDYLVHVDPGDARVAPSTYIPVTVGAAPTTEVTVEVPRRCQRLLRLRAADGAPVPATVELLDTCGLPRQLEAEARGLVEWDHLRGLSSVIVLQHADADAQGELELEGPTGHDLAVRLRGQGIALQTVAPVRLDDEGPLEITVQCGAIWTGRLVPAAVAADLFAGSQPQAGQQDAEVAFGIELSRQGDTNDGPETRRFLEPAFPYDTEGRFRIAGIPAGTWQVVVLALGVRFHCDEITVREGSTLERDLDVADLGPCTLELQVFVDGAPLANGTLWVFGAHAPDHAGRPLGTFATHQLDAAGRTQLRTFAGVLAFRVHAGSGTIHAPQLLVPTGGHLQRTLDVQRATLALRLLTPVGQPAADVALQIDGDYGFRAATDDEGRIHTSAVAAGRHSLRVRPRKAASDDEWIDLGPIDVAPGANRERALRLPPEWDR